MILVCYNKGIEASYNFNVGKQYTLTTSLFDDHVEIYHSGDVVSYYFKKDTWKKYFRTLDEERDIKINKLLNGKERRTNIR